MSGTRMNRTDPIGGSTRTSRVLERTRREGSSGWGLVALILFMVSFAAFGYCEVTGQQTGFGLVLLPLLILAAAPLIIWSGKAETRFDLTGIMLAGFALSMLGALPRYLDAADAIIYNNVGAELAESFRKFDFTVDTGREIPGTGWIRYITGIVHVFTSSDMFATFLIFAAFAFFGRVFFYKAFTMALPEGDHARYAKLVFLWPSLAFWPSSIGKEAWMIFYIGLVAYGAARLFAHQRFGVTWTVVGLMGCTMVRPHVALLLLSGLIVALFFRSSKSGSSLRFVGKILVTVLFLIGGSMLANETATFLNVDDLSASSLTTALDETSAQTAQGGSEFTSARVNSPVDLPWAAITLVFRPFPYEAQGLNMLLTSIEGLVLGMLCLTSIPRMGQLPKLLRSTPYLVFVLAFMFTFIFAFSAIGNFGLLARQRTQMTAFLFVLLSLPRSKPAKTELRRPMVTGAWATTPRHNPLTDPDAPASFSPRPRASR